MAQKANSKLYDLEERTLRFAKNIREFVKAVPKTVSNQEDVRQLVRSSGSVGANYIEANESLGRKDFIMHARISRKEAKESRFWLDLIEPGTAAEKKEFLMQEATELMSIFGVIVRKSES